MVRALVIAHDGLFCDLSRVTVTQEKDGADDVMSTTRDISFTLIFW